MREAGVLPGATIRWVELQGAEPARVFLHGLGSSSPPYYAAAAAHPALIGHRSLLVDLLGFGVSDRPAGFDYTLEAQADVLATALRAGGVEVADVIGHSMGGVVAALLAERHPELVRRLVVVDTYLGEHRPDPADIAWQVADHTEAEFLAEGWAATLDRAGPFWAATMRLAGPEALYRSFVDLIKGDRPPTGQALARLTIPRTYLHRADGEPPPADLAASGVSVVAIPDCGHNIMIDNVDGFARAVAEALDGLGS